MTNASTQPAHDLRVVPFRAPQDAAVTLDDRFRYTAVTPEAASTLDMTPAVLLGQRCWDVFPEWEHTPSGALTRLVMHTRVAGEVRHPAPDQSDRDIHARVMPTPDGGVRFVFRMVTRAPLASRPVTSLDSMTGTR